MGIIKYLLKADCKNPIIRLNYLYEQKKIFSRILRIKTNWASIPDIEHNLVIKNNFI